MWERVNVGKNKQKKKKIKNAGYSEKITSWSITNRSVGEETRGNWRIGSKV